MNVTRRTFLISSAAGALAVGCSLGPAGTRIGRHFARTGVFQPNAWIRILPSGTIVFTLDRVEMGQGTMTSHAAMVCEELEVDPASLVIEHAEADRRYDNRDKQINIQITGGSTSTRSSWKPLREAGAVAREMLKAGAAARWRVPHREVIARDGRVYHDTSKRSASYGELVPDAAAQDVPRVTLKAPENFTKIGKSLNRLDARPKVDGTGVYGIDVQLPGMLTAVIVRSPVRGGTVAKLDDKAARARKGVVDVLRIPEGVAVVAEGYWEARTGAELLQITWDEGAGATLDSADLDVRFERLAKSGGTVVGKRGSAALKGTTLEAVYRTPYLAHATMEPQNATAWIRDGRCEVWAPTQSAGITQWRVAEAIGFELDDVAVHTTMIGGGFGRRGLVDYSVEAARVAQRVGRPVKVIWSREDDMANDAYRPMAVHALAGAVENGEIRGWHHGVCTQSIMASEGGDFIGALVPNGTPRALRRVAAASGPRLFARALIPDPTATEGAHDLPYAIPNFRVRYANVEVPIPVGFWRSVGHSHTAFATECFLDELIHAAGKDPFEVRRQLLAKHPRHLGVLELAAQKASWGTPLPAGVGRGIAVHESFHSFCAQVIEASVEGTRVKVHRVVVAIDCGRVINPGLVAAQAESAVIFGLSACLKQHVTFKAGRVQETNFHTYKSLRMFECPIIDTHLVASTEDPTGIGEPGVPPVAPALANAIFAATGKRVRSLPIEEALR